ncbi:hypothetical protein M3U23_15730 [Xanthomonas sp. PPL129]
MRFQRLLFVVVLYLMAASTFVVFVSNVVPWFQYRLSSAPARLFLLPQPVGDSPQDEIRVASDQRKYGHAVLLKLESGETLSSHAHLKSDQYKQASSDQGLPVLYRKDGPNKVQVIGNLQELESPWVWLALCIVLSIVAPYAGRLRAREMAS